MVSAKRGKPKKENDKGKVALMAPCSKGTKYTGPFKNEIECRRLSDAMARQVHTFLGFAYKNLKLLPNKGWEVELETLGVIDDLIKYLGKDGDTVEDRIWRSRNWRLLLCQTCDWFKQRQKNLMSAWGRQVKSKLIQMKGNE